MASSNQPVNVYQMPKDHSFFIDLLNHGNFLETYEHFLRGEELSIVPKKEGKGFTEEWIKRYPPRMNDYGINEVMTHLRPICESKIVALTDLGEEQIDERIYSNAQSFTELLLENSEEFEIPSLSVLKSIEEAGKTIIISQFRRSKDATTLMQLTTQTTIHENRQIPLQQEHERGGPFNKVPFFSKLKI